MEKKKNRRRRDWNFILGAGIIGAILLFVLVGFIYLPYDANAMDSSVKLAAPSMQHPFGCDNFGRDIYCRVQQGIRVSVLIAVSTVAIGVFVGTILGAVTGFYGGIVDAVLMRIIDVLFSLPSILLALVFVSLFGSTTQNVVYALGLALIPSFAKMIRTEFIKQKNMDYVKMAKLIGASDFRILFVHILPNIMPTFWTCVLVAFNNVILAEASMSYLGIGVQPPNASLGRMLSEAQTYLRYAPWNTIFPGAIMILLILGFGLLSEGKGWHAAYRQQIKH